MGAAPVAGLLYAYAVRFASPALQTVDSGLAKVRPSLEDAARGLGRTPGQTLLSVHLPMLIPSLATAGLIVFVETLKELPATLLIRPFNFDTLAVLAWARAADERVAESAWPALAVVAAALVPVLLLRAAAGLRLERGDGAALFGAAAGAAGAAGPGPFFRRPQRF